MESSARKNFLHDGRLTPDDLTIRQVFFINTFAILGFISVTTFGLPHLLDRNYNIAFAEITGGMVFVLAIVYLRISKNIKLAKTLLLLTQGSLLIVMLATGGTAGTGIFWYFTFPITSFFLMGRKNGLIWILCLYIATLFVFILGNFNLVSIAYSFIEIRQLLASILISSALIYLYQSSIEKSEAKYRQQTSQLEVAKRALEQAKAEDEAILASLGEGMITMGTSGNIFLVNKAAREMLKVTEDAAGRAINELILLKNLKGDEITPGERPWYLAANKGIVTSGEYIFARPDKLEFPVTLTTAPIVLNDQIIGVIELFRDITEERKLDQAKSEFVALASHQLRTPISAIAWFSEMLLSGDAGELTKEQKDQLTQIYQSNQRMAALVDALLNVSRLEMGNFSVTPMPTNFASFCHKVLLEELDKQEPLKRFEIKEHYDPRIVSFPVDQDLMKIILQNLFTNAIKYTPENGTISISVSPSGQSSQDSVNNKEEGILIIVSDTGYGIPKNQQNRIFSKLFRADNIKAKDTDGTGLGLYIVKSIIEAVGGKIWFESQENKGTAFYVFLQKEGMRAKTGDKKLVPAKNNE